MKLTTLLFFLAFMQVTASSLYSQTQKMRLDFQKKTLAEVFSEIEKNSNFSFFYKNELLADTKPKTGHYENVMITEVLDDLLKDENLTYTSRGKLIMIVPKEDLAAGNIWQANQPVKGKVADSSGNPLPGVTVVVKGSTTGTITGSDGRYLLTNIPGDATLVFSFVGMKTQEIPVAGNTTINLSMVEDAIGIEEVVAIGYGMQRKSDITGSVSSVKGEELRQLPMQRVDQALQGRASGVLVLNTAGAPGAETTIRIRGMNSINGGNSALIVVDGLQGGDLNTINPNDIESLEILKDASATAIYGSRGANGVILITTKSGKKGKPRINYIYDAGFQSIRDKLDLMNAAEYARAINDSEMAENGYGTPVPIFSDEQIAEFERTGGTDWQDVIYRTAPIQNHQLSMDGGAEKLTYRVSAGYLNQEGILINSEYKRFTLRTNIAAEITRSISFGLNWAVSREDGNSPPYGGGTALSFLGQAVNVAPRWGATTPPYDEDGNYNSHPSGYGAFDTWNPLAAAKEPDIQDKTVENNISSYLDFRFAEGLIFRVTGGATVQNTKNKSYYNSLTYEGQPVGGKVGYGKLSSSMVTRYQNSNILTYNKILGLNQFTLMAVAEQQFEKSEGFDLVASKFAVDQTGINDLGGAEQISEKSSVVEERVINSYLGRINYVYADKYLMTATYRVDGSSVFGSNNKWAHFPSGSLAWRVSQESFMESMKVISNLKLRGSWGVTGNQAISPYQTIAAMESGYNYPYEGSSVTDLGFRIASASNPNLKWESTTQINLGLDAGLFDGRLNAAIDVYKKKTEDLLLNRTLPSYTGLESILDNVGSVENKGLELALSGDPFVNRFKWHSEFNISWNRNRVLDLGENERLEFSTTDGGYSISNGFMQLRVGEPFGQMYGYGIDGVWKESEATEAAKYGQLPGDMKYSDMNHDGQITPSDIKIIGNSIPNFIFGWSNRFSYGRFELMVLIQGSKGNDIFNQARIRLERPGEGTSVRLLDRWTPDNQDTDVPAIIDDVTRANAALTSTIKISGDTGRLSRWVEDGSYARLKNITLGYNIPQSVLNKFGLTQAKIYASGTDLLTLTNYTGYDPEVSAYNSNDAQIGVDFSNYPTAKTFTFGISISF